MIAVSSDEQNRDNKWRQFLDDLRLQVLGHSGGFGTNKNLVDCLAGDEALDPYSVKQKKVSRAE